MTKPTLNQVYANNAQVVDVQSALETAEFLIQVSNIFSKELEQELVNLWKFRAYAFLNRACELECVPVHVCVAETGDGLEDAWFTYIMETESSPVALPPSFFFHQRFIGYCSTLTESQARMRALS